MQKYKVCFSYFGKDFRGLQKQIDADELKTPSIQKTFEQALFSITQEKCVLVSSGRTDAGVHAIEQVAHFILSKDWALRTLKEALNARLPPAIRVISVEKATADFHAQHDVTAKQYSYYFQEGPCSLPMFQSVSVWVRKPLDVAAMKKAISHLKGTHDFVSFQGRGAKPVPTIKTLQEVEVVRLPIAFPGSPALEGSDFAWVRIRLKGDGFLKQMVRGIAGTLLQVGEGRRPSEDLKMIISGKNRKKTGPTAPPQGLFLEKVWY